MCVLATGSAGNCSVVEVRERGRRRVWLIDLGLSPKRTARLLAERGIALDEVSDVFLTHLDADHCHRAWFARDLWDATIHVHEDHRVWAEQRGVRRTRAFGSSFELDSIAVDTSLEFHDEMGVAAFRFRTPLGCLGFATDLGSVTSGLIDTLRGVDVLAIESNYCPRLQERSARPSFLKRRIMGGAGHLSNEQCRRAIEMIEPRGHVVFLHVSRDCNEPAIIARLHAGADYGFTIATQAGPSRWVQIRAHGPLRERAAHAHPQGMLFS